MNVDPAFERVVNAYYQPLYRFALALSRSESAASDLVQETFHRFATKGHQLREDSKAKTWLFTTLYREFLRTNAAQARWEVLDENEDCEERADVPMNCGEAAIDGALARDALSRLDEAFRAPLALFYLQQHSYAEIAAILDVPMGTVMSRIARGREMLRRALGVGIRKPGHPLLMVAL